MQPMTLRRFASNLAVVTTTSVVTLLFRYRWPQHWHHLMIFYAVLAPVLLVWALLDLRRKRNKA